jgi:hypothetical protein
MLLQDRKHGVNMCRVATDNNRIIRINMQWLQYLKTKEKVSQQIVLLLIGLSKNIKESIEPSFFK